MQRVGCVFVLVLALLGGCAADDGTGGRDKMGGDEALAAGAGGTAGADGSGFGNPTAGVSGGAPPMVINPGGSGCAPGHYVGSFEGTYNSAAWGNGAAPLVVEAVESAGEPGLEFWLEATEAPCTAEEFCADFTVKGGKMRGFADPFADPNSTAPNPLALAVRFEIDFGGDLDCTTGTFRGLLENGCYDVATVLYRFDGEAPADYDKSTTTFDNGTWEVKEMEMPGSPFPPDANIGGDGTWTASLADDGTSPVAAGMGLCD